MKEMDFSNPHPGLLIRNTGGFVDNDQHNYRHFVIISRLQ